MNNITKTGITLAQIKRNASKIEDDRLYTAPEIETAGFILNAKAFTIYRMIKRGELQAIAMGTDKKPLYHVAGKELKKYLAKHYPFIK